MVLVLAFAVMTVACGSAPTKNDYAVVEKSENVSQESVREQPKKTEKNERFSVKSHEPKSVENEQKISEKAVDKSENAGDSADKQKLMAEAIEAKLDQLADKVEIYRENPRENIGQIIRAWEEDSKETIHAQFSPILDKLADKILKPDSEILQQEIELGFAELQKIDASQNRSYFGFFQILESWAYRKGLTEEEEKKNEEEIAEMIKKLEELKPMNPSIIVLSQEEIEEKVSHFKISLGERYAQSRIQEGINIWSRARTIKLWNQLLNNFTDKRWEVIPSEAIQKEIEKIFDELINALTKEEKIRTELSKRNENFFQKRIDKKIIEYKSKKSDKKVVPEKTEEK